MSSLSPKDRASLCIFSYADGRRCRTPRIADHPHFCYDHAQKESRAATADKLAKVLSAFFSGHYISANDVATAVARLIPAVVRGDIKPRTARTVAYMAQTLLQSIHLAQSEFKDAFGPDALRKSVRSGITSNHDRLFPPNSEPKPAPASTESASPKSTSTPTPNPTPPQPPPVCHPERSEGPRLDPASPTNAETRPTAATQPTESSDQPTTPTPVQRQRPYNPTGDPYVTYFDHTYRLR